MTDVSVIGVAKGQDRDAGNETFYLLDSQAVKLPPRDPLLYFIQRLRDEAHRLCAIGSRGSSPKKGRREAACGSAGCRRPARRAFFTISVR